MILIRKSLLIRIKGGMSTDGDYGKAMNVDIDD